MRIPFIKKDIKINKDRFVFIKSSRGGCSMLFGGTLYWLYAAINSLFMPNNIIANIYIFGGLSVPILGYIISKIQGISLMQKNVYTSLVILASTIVPFCLPVLILIGKIDTNLIAPTLAIINGAHFLILMWIHLDYTYFLVACAELVIGILFMFSFPNAAPIGVGFLSTIVLFIGGITTFLSTKNPLSGYNLTLD